MLLTKQKSDSIYQVWMQHAGNNWIDKDSTIGRALRDLVACMPKGLQTNKELKKVIFVRPSGHLAFCVPREVHAPLVFLMPEIVKLLSTAARWLGIAVLAHELGHVFHQHPNKDLSILEEQVQADNFTCQLGLGSECEEILMAMPESIEKRVRLSYVTRYNLLERYSPKEASGLR